MVSHLKPSMMLEVIFCPSSTTNEALSSKLSAERISELDALIMAASASSVN